MICSEDSYACQLALSKAGTSKLHGRPTRKYDKIMWRAIKQMWGTTEVYNIFSGFLQKWGKFIGF